MRKLASVRFSSYEESIIDYFIHDILVCKFPDLAIVDASIGQIGGEVWGTAKKFGLILAGDPLEVDKKGAEVLGKDWRKIKHITWTNELKGDYH